MRSAYIWPFLLKGLFNLTGCNSPAPNTFERLLYQTQPRDPPGTASSLGWGWTGHCGPPALKAGEAMPLSPFLSCPEFFRSICGPIPLDPEAPLRDVSHSSLCPCCGPAQTRDPGRRLSWTGPVLLKGLLGGWGSSGAREIPPPNIGLLPRASSLLTVDPVWEMGRADQTLHQAMPVSRNTL